MPNVYIDGNPVNEEEKQAMLGSAFDDFMLKIPLEQRRFLRNFGFSESEIDEVLKAPDLLNWKFRKK